MNMNYLKGLLNRALLPDDRENALVNGYICIKSAGNRGLFVEGHRGLSFFSESETAFSGKDFSLRVTGEKLVISALSRESAALSGDISAVLFERNEK